MTRRIKSLAWAGATFSVLGAAGVWWLSAYPDVGSKQVVGPTVVVAVPEAGLEFAARVDTGAATTSVNARSIQVRDGMVDFVVANGLGEQAAMMAPLVKIDVVHTGAGSEKRVYVELTVIFEGRKKRVLANLNDRSHLDFPLLLGRNWLEGDYVVDVAGPSTDFGELVALGTDEAEEGP